MPLCINSTQPSVTICAALLASVKELALRRLLARTRPVTACQVHDWTSREDKWLLTNESLLHVMIDCWFFTVGMTGDGGICRYKLRA